MPPANDLESAIIADLAPGGYTAVVRGVNDTVGTGIVDAYDMSPASPARLANVSTRGLIQPGDQLMIAGFIIQSGDVRAVVRAIGPSLNAFGITNALPDTTLELRDVNGALVQSNDDWESDQKQELENTGLQPGNSLEAALIERSRRGNTPCRCEASRRQPALAWSRFTFFSSSRLLRRCSPRGYAAGTGLLLVLLLLIFTLASMRSGRIMSFGADTPPCRRR